MVQGPDGKWVSGTSLAAGPIRIIGKQVLDELDQDRTRHTEKNRATKEALGGMRSAREATRKLPKWSTAAAVAAEVLEEVVAKHNALFDDIWRIFGHR